MGELAIPLANGFAISFESVSILDGSDSMTGFKEIQAKLTMKGKSKVEIGGQREAWAWTPGIPDWSVAIKFELTWWTEYMRKHPGYADEVLTRTFAYLSLAREYSCQFIGLSFLDQDNTATKGSDGGLEVSTNWGVLRVKHTVDNVEIPYLAEGLL